MPWVFLSDLIQMTNEKSPDGHCWNAYHGCHSYGKDDCMCPCAACIAALGGTYGKPRRKPAKNRRSRKT